MSASSNNEGRWSSKSQSTDLRDSLDQSTQFIVDANDNSGVFNRSSNPKISDGDDRPSFGGQKVDEYALNLKSQEFQPYDYRMERFGSNAITNDSRMRPKIDLSVLETTESKKTSEVRDSEENH